ncbi:MAG: lipopolysaccharide assembly protein LapB [Gammaproteobacteria bacterium]|nr:lipopolysaccharide assembly protein LapB [Gammaproteobacteria bacterium]
MGQLLFITLPCSLVIMRTTALIKHLVYYRRRRRERHFYRNLTNVAQSHDSRDNGINFFVNSSVNKDNVKTHLILGNLFSRRGEMNRAVHIHENLASGPNLNQEERSQGLLALARDYLAAGLLDHAERLFKDLIAMQLHVETSLCCLLDIYQQEKSWLQAIDTAKQLAYKGSSPMSQEIAHYYCELAECSIEEGASDQGAYYLKKALNHDWQCARASLLLGHLEYASGRHKHAISLYKRVRTQNPAFISEALIPLAEAYQSLNEEEMFEFYIDKLAKRFPKLPVALLFSHKICEWYGIEVAQERLLEYLQHYPSIAGLYQLLELKFYAANSDEKKQLLDLKTLTAQLLTEYHPYACEICGFSSQRIHWLCPSCRRWNSVKSVYLIEEHPLPSLSANEQQ